MEEKQQSGVSEQVHRNHSTHHHRRHRRHKPQYSRERQSYNSTETRFILMWTLIAVLLMVVLIPLLANLTEKV